AWRGVGRGSPAGGALAVGSRRRGVGAESRDGVGGGNQFEEGRGLRRLLGRGRAAVPVGAADVQAPARSGGRHVGGPPLLAEVLLPEHLFRLVGGSGGIARGRGGEAELVGGALGRGLGVGTPPGCGRE